MIIRPVTDLRNHFPDVESDLRESGHIYLTKNGYGMAVLMDISEYIRLTGDSAHLPEASGRKKSLTADRGFLSSYANPDLVSLEKDAGRLHALKKHGAEEVSADE